MHHRFINFTLFYSLLIGILCLLAACNAVTETRKSVALNNVPSVEEDHTTIEVQDNDLPDGNTIYRATQKRSNDLIHTKLDVRFNWEKQHVMGKATLTLKPYFYPTNTLELDAKGFDIHKVVLQTNTGEKTLAYEYNDLLLQITLDKTYTRHQDYVVYIEYTAKPYELTENHDYYTYENQGLYFINHLGTDPNKPQQIWTQGETESSSCWFPTIDMPNERCSQEIAITVDKKFVTLSNGKLLRSTNNADGSRTDYWKQELPHAPYLFAMAICEYAVVHDEWNGMDVDYYVEREYEKYAKSIFGNTPEMLSFYSDTLNYPYPWDKYAQAVVRDFVAGAMENTGAVLFYERLQMTDEELVDGHHEDIIAHELFHHWFGDLVTCESWSNLALNEAFATYGEYLWFAHKYGQAYADNHIARDLRSYLDEASNKQVPIVRFYYDDREDMFDAHSYQKGGRVLHMLRNYVGDEAFFIAVQAYVKKHAFKTAEIHDLRMAFEEVTGEDLNWFFQQWFLSKGHPIVDITYDYDTTSHQVIVHINQVQKANKVYRLPLAIDVYQADSSVNRHQVLINTKKSRFVFDAPKPPRLVNVDADKVMLWEKRNDQSIDAYMYQYRHAPLYLDRYEAILALTNKQYLPNQDLKQCIIEAMNDDFWKIREHAVDNFVIDNKARTTIEQTLIPLVEKDEKSSVRAAAIAKLASLEDTSHVNIIKKSLKDPSDFVVSNALHYLQQLSLPDAIKAANIIEKKAKGTTANMIAKMYADFGEADKQQYFEQRLAKANKVDKYTLIEYYGDFLSRHNTSIPAGLNTLENIAKNDNNWWIRLHATQTLAILRDACANAGKASTVLVNQQNTEHLNTIERLIDDIKTQETDEKLLQYYQNM